MYQFFTALFLASIGAINHQPTSLAKVPSVATEVSVELNSSETAFNKLTAQWNTLPSFTSFDIAFKGYELLKSQGKITCKLSLELLK